MLIHEVWPQLWPVVLLSLPSAIDWWDGLGWLCFLKCQTKSSEHHFCLSSRPLPLGWARKRAVIVSAPLTYLKCVCLGWREVSCWDFNLLTEPSAAVVELHISGIKSEAVQHARHSSCTRAHSDLYTLCNTHTHAHAHLSSHNKNKWHVLSSKCHRFAHIDKRTHVQQCHFPCCSHCQTMSLHCPQLKALITILLRHVIILMLSMEMNWPTIDLQ